jgi:hypothetical protein
MADRPQPTGLSNLPLTTSTVYLAHSLIGVAIAFILLSTAIFGARLFTRSRPVVHFGRDDWVACVAYVSALMVDWKRLSSHAVLIKRQTLTTMDACMAVVSVRFALGKNPQFLPTTELPHIGLMAFMEAVLGAWAMAAIKTSVACVFLRLRHTKPWRVFLVATITAQCLMALFITIMHATRYIPLDAQWSPDLAIRNNAQVWSDWAFGIAISVTSSINILTDIVFSLLPLVFLREIQRPLREKVVIGGLMAMGLVGSSASVIKTTKVHNFGKGNNPLANGIRIALWSLLEEQLGFIAACVPCLKALFQRFLCHFGLITTSRSRTAGHRAYIDISGQRNSRHNNIRVGANETPFFALSDDGTVLANSDDVEGQKGMARVAHHHVEEISRSGSNSYELGSLGGKGLS